MRCSVSTEQQGTQRGVVVLSVDSRSLILVRFVSYLRNVDRRWLDGYDCYRSNRYDWYSPTNAITTDRVILTERRISGGEQITKDDQSRRHYKTNLRFHQTIPFGSCDT